MFNFEGAGVADASVRLTGQAGGGARQTTSDGRGSFGVEYLPPGEYEVEVTHASLGKAVMHVLVHAGQETYCESTLGVRLSETIEVAGHEPVIDRRPQGQGTSLAAAVVDALPVERSYRGLLQLMPGLPENRSNVGFAFGAGRQENTYVVDGVTITNPAFGYQGTEVNPLDVADVNFQQAGISAEFGRAGGFVVNLATQHGSNRPSATVRLDWLPARFIGSPKLEPSLSELAVPQRAFIDPLLSAQFMPAGNGGGAVLHDRLFFYASAQFARADRWDVVNRVGAVLPHEQRRDGEAFGKLTLALPGANQVVLSLRDRSVHVDHAALTAATSPDLGLRTEGENRQVSAVWNATLGRDRTFSVQASDATENHQDLPERSLGYLPAFDVAHPDQMGQYADPTLANLTVGARAFATRQDYRRTSVRGRAAQVVRLGRSVHQFRFGASWERAKETFQRSANGWGTIANVTVSGTPLLRTRYYAPQSPQVGRGTTEALFVQNDIEFGRLLVGVGLLANRDTFAQVVDGSGGCPAALAGSGAAVYVSAGDECRFLRFGYRTQLQPRLGASLRLRRTTIDKAYVTWGRYSGMEQKSSIRSLAPRAIAQTQTLFDLSGTVVSTGLLASTTGKLIDPALEPTYTNELSMGYATPLGSGYELEVSGLRRSTYRFIEDVPSRLSGSAPDSGPYVAANLPCVAYAACQNANANRTYRAVGLSFRRSRVERWWADLSYTWSGFEGNVDFDYATVAVFNTSSFIQDGPGTNVEEPNRQGPLLEDRPHVMKAGVFVRPAARWSFGALVRLQSGAPWAARARDWEGGVLNYLERAGVHRNPTWTNADVLVGYDPRPLRRLRTHLELRVFNVFDRQTRLSTDAQQYLDLRTLAAPPYFAQYLQPNPYFATGNLFAPPRRAQVSLDIRF